MMRDEKPSSFAVLSCSFQRSATMSETIAAHSVIRSRLGASHKA